METRKQWTQRQLIRRVTGLPMPSAKQEAQWAEQEKDARARYRQQQASREWRKANPDKVLKGWVWLVASWLIIGGIVWGVYAVVHH
jgi:hypothetical protein